MTELQVEDIYQQVHRKITDHPEIKLSEPGLLYKTILIINQEESSNSPLNTNVICDEYGIKSDASIEDDAKVYTRLFARFFNDKIIFNYNKLPAFLKKESTKNWLQKQEVKKMIIFNFSGEQYMEWIIVVAVSLVGIVICKQFIENQQKEAKSQREFKKLSRVTQFQQTYQPSMRAFLSLVVPASIVKQLKIEEGQQVNIEIINKLIDTTYYFNCGDREDADTNEENLKLTADPIPGDSPVEVYVRINIEDGINLLENTIRLRYTLKENLPEQGMFKIEKIARLGSFRKGLEKFVRI
ncbi:MAG: hypothetical protein N5P05_003653 [Chroococcopsis gigantea SAG 12.99]|nr:hypothetical protein [Chroococcopsis gigantea SAG 12.99]